MANINDILSRTRVIATGVGIDPNLSALIDNRPALRALLNTAFSTVYRKRAQSKKDWRDISVRHTVSMSGGSGAIPNELMREFLHQADFEDEEGSLISYIEYNIDNRQLFTQLGYVRVVGDTFDYNLPDAGGAYTGDLYVTAVSVPEFPATPTDDIPMTAEIFDDVCGTLATMLRAEMPLV